MFNKKEIMNRANTIRKEGYSLSDALTKAWVEAKISIIDNQLFDLNMIDMQSAKEKEAVCKLNAERRALVSKAGIVETTKKVAVAATERIENPYLTAEQKADIENQMFNMMTQGIYNGTFSMDAYKALESRLYITAAEATQIA